MSHALLSASASKRWLSCTPSARFELEFPESTSEYAEEGTLAHELAAKILLKQPVDRSSYDPEMWDYIFAFCELVWELSIGKQIFIEQHLDYSAWVPEGYGTGDVVIIHDGAIEVVDLKYGKGVPISAIDNPQLRLYGLGAYHMFDYLYEFKTVRTTIVQPRLDAVSSEELSIGDLLNWANDYVMPRAKLAYEGAGDYVSGDHCRFCRGKAECKARAASNLELAKYDFKNPNLLTSEELADILGQVDRLVTWASDVKEYALAQAEAGVRWNGWKLVAGRSVRRYIDSDAVVTKLLSEGVEEALVYRPREVLGITEMEKLLGKKRFESVLGDLVLKPEGKPVLVKSSDKRPELGAAVDFKD